MPIKIDVHDNTSEVRVRPKGEDEIKVRSGCDVNIRHLEALINQEIQDRIVGDENLQNQINQLVSSSKVVAVVSVYDKQGLDQSDLVHFDTTNLVDEDVIIVVRDENYNDKTTFYKWLNQEWNYLNILPYYSEEEIDTKFSDVKLGIEVIDNENCLVLLK